MDYLHDHEEIPTHPKIMKINKTEITDTFAKPSRLWVCFVITADSSSGTCGRCKHDRISHSVIRVSLRQQWK